MKKYLSILLALAMLLTLLAGCGGAGTPANDSKSESKSQTDTDDKNDGEEVIEPCTLNFISWMTKGEDLPLLDDFMAENEGIKVVNRSLDGTNYASLVNTMLMGGDVPDVFLCNSSMIKDLVDGGYIRPIGDIPGVEKQAKNEALNELMSYNGEVYGYCVNGSKGNYFVYYNQYYFEEHDLEIPTTMAEFEALLEQIKGFGDVDPLAVSAGDTWSANYAAGTIITTNKYDLGTAASRELELAFLEGGMKPSAIYREAFEKLAEWNEKGYVSKNTLAMGWETTMQYLVDGGCGVFVTGNWGPGSGPVQSADPETFKIGCFPLPVDPSADGLKHINSGSDRVVVLSAKTEHPEAAMKLFQYWIDDEVLVKYLERQGLLGMNVTAKVDPVFEYAYAEFDKPEYVLEFGSGARMPSGYEPNVSQYFADIFSGADIEELLQKIDDDYDAAMSTVDVQEYLDVIYAELGK